MNNKSLLRGIVIGLGIAFAVVAIFSLGVFVGEQKARFSLRWGRHYDRQFGGPRMMPGGRRGFFGGHGIAGVVLKKNSKSLVVGGGDNIEKIVLISDKTRIVKGRQRMKLKDVKKDTNVVVVGSPDDKGRIEARLIRLFEGKPDRRGGLLWRNDMSRPLLPS